TARQHYHSTVYCQPSSGSAAYTPRTPPSSLRCLVPLLQILCLSYLFIKIQLSKLSPPTGVPKLHCKSYFLFLIVVKERKARTSPLQFSVKSSNSVGHPGNFLILP